jgi:hypothetical protein
VCDGDDHGPVDLPATDERHRDDADDADDTSSARCRTAG